MSPGLPSSRAVGLFALMVLLVLTCVRLGFWQLGVAQDEGRRAAVEAAGQLPRAPLQQVTKPHAAFAGDYSNRPVSVTGTYAAGHSLVVVDRRLGGRVGSWVVTPLVTTDGATVAVLRGFVDGTPATAPEPPAGAVEVLGTLGPTESPSAGSPLPPGQVHSIDLAVLVNEWPGELYNVVVLASSETSAGSPVAPAGLSRVPPPELDAGLNLRNAAYAIQWWVFGIFFIWMWWKMLRAAPRGQVRPVAPKEEAHA